MKEKYFTDEEWKLLQAEIEEGYVNCNKHPEFDLYIYNYTPKTQYNWHWNDITIRCRGLILDANGCLVAKGFDKFFTDEQLVSNGIANLIPTDEPFEIFDKADGSLGVMYFWEDKAYIATRGSFESEMAIEANKWLENQYGHIVFFPEYTYMFEIIYPENRIVVDYGSERKLVLLAVLDNETLKEKDIYSEEFDYIEEQGLERVKKFDGYSDWKEIMEEFKDEENIEGFVVRFLNSDFRVKMKLEWYKNLAYIMTYFTKRSVWKMIRDGKNVEKVIADINDEYYPMVKCYVDELQSEYDKIYDEADAMRIHLIEWMNSSDKYPRGYTKGDFVHELKDRVGHPSFMFGLVMRMANGKDPFNMIWRKIEPRGTEIDLDKNI